MASVVHDLNQNPCWKHALLRMGRPFLGYPATCPNKRGDVGIVLCRGGGTIHPSHVVGAWNPDTSSWELRGTRNGTHGPSDSKWGDYLDIKSFSGNGLSWVANGFVLSGGNTRTSVEPRLVQFYRRIEGARQGRILGGTWVPHG